MRRRDSAALQSPVFIEEAGRYDLARKTPVRRSRGIDYRVIRQFGCLPRVAAPIRVTEGETAIQHYVPLWVEGVRKYQDRSMARRRETLLSDCQPRSIPRNR